jgi:HEAT repeat protein
LGKIGNKEDIKKLGDLLRKNKSGRVTAEIINVLAAKGRDDDLELIKPFLESNNDDIQRAVIEAIGKLGTSGDIEIIMELKQKEVSNMIKRMSYPGDEEYDDLRRHELNPLGLTKKESGLSG